MIAILLAPVYLLANFYLLRRVMGWVKAWFPFFRTARHWALPVAVQAFLACSIVIAFFLPEGRLRRVMKLIGNYWLGVLLYVLLAVIAADLLRLLLGYVLPFKHIFITTKMHRIAGCVCALAIFAASVWGVINARIIHVTPYDVTVDKTVEGMSEMKVVLVADLHLGYNIGEKQMQQMVNRINEQDADLVVIAGDIFDNEWEAVNEPETIAATLRSIRSKYGVYACYGNHDIEEAVLAGFTFRQSEKKESDPRMDAFLKDANITLLHDEGTLIDGKFYLYGRPDAHRPGRGIETRKTPDEITADMDQSKPIIVLDHQPKELQALADAGVDLDLCGHTADVGERLRISQKRADAQYRHLRRRAVRAQYARGYQGGDLPHHRSFWRKLKAGRRPSSPAGAVLVLQQKSMGPPNRWSHTFLHSAEAVRDDGCGLVSRHRAGVEIELVAARRAPGAAGIALVIFAALLVHLADETHRLIA